MTFTSIYLYSTSSLVLLLLTTNTHILAILLTGYIVQRSYHSHVWRSWFTAPLNQVRSQPCSCLTENDSHTPESPWQAWLGMCQRAKWLPRPVRERLRREVHTWHSDAGGNGQWPGSVITVAQTRIHRHLCWNSPHSCCCPHCACHVNAHKYFKWTNGKCHICREARQPHSQTFSVSNSWKVSSYIRTTVWMVSFKLLHHMDAGSTTISIHLPTVQKVNNLTWSVKPASVHTLNVSYLLDYLLVFIMLLVLVS